MYDAGVKNQKDKISFCIDRFMRLSAVYAHIWCCLVNPLQLNMTPSSTSRQTFKPSGNEPAGNEPAGGHIREQSPIPNRLSHEAARFTALVKLSVVIVWCCVLQQHVCMGPHVITYNWTQNIYNELIIFVVLVYCLYEHFPLDASKACGKTLTFSLGDFKSLTFIHSDISWNF